MILHAVIEVFLWLTGLCVGSFLNVVAYRLPAGLSISDPVRSFCPRCRHMIAWYDNIPVLSWVMLGGRCRSCHQPISLQYPLVEALTGFAFVLVYHLLFVLHARDGAAHATLPTDLPLLVSWLILTAGLVVCSAMDITSYVVDVRVTLIVLATGLICTAAWPASDFFADRAATPSAAAACAAFLVSILLLWLTVWRVPDEEPPLTDQHDETDDEPQPPHRPQVVAGGIGIVALVGITGWIILIALGNGPHHLEVAHLAAGISMVALFLCTVVIGGQQRPADDEIRHAIEEEQPHARRIAASELLWLLPIIIAGGAVHAALHYSPAAQTAWTNFATWSPAGQFALVGGLAFAIHGAIVGATAGWMLRIVFTLLFGREAFGIGDVYILAAAGAAAGWDIALLGLALSVGIALLGWLAGLLLKTTVMIPFGPWLALGFLLALWLSRAAASIIAGYRDNLAYAWQQRPDLILTGVGLMLVATAFSVVFARFVRRLVERSAV